MDAEGRLQFVVIPLQIAAHITLGEPWKFLLQVAIAYSTGRLAHSQMFTCMGLKSSRVLRQAGTWYHQQEEEEKTFWGSFPDCSPQHTGCWRWLRVADVQLFNHHRSQHMRTREEPGVCVSVGPTFSDVCLSFLSTFF